MVPNEADVVPDAYPDFPGIKHAAIRKCRHELGITPEYLPHDQIQFISRFHYWAADTVTYGKETCPWGEHEVDYILFMKTDKEVPLVPAADEVSDYKYVSLQELKEMMKEPGLVVESVVLRDHGTRGLGLVGRFGRQLAGQVHQRQGHLL